MGFNVFSVRVIRALARIAIAGALLPIAREANAQEELPTYKILSCEQSCGHFTSAHLISKSSIAYPARDLQLKDTYVEGRVVVNYSIASDGHVKNAVIEELVGPPEFGEAAIENVDSWIYKPATEDGKAVDENNRLAQFMFIVKDGTGARNEVVRAYRSAVALSLDGKITQAIAALNTVLAMPRLNFYERSMVADALAGFYVKQQDYDDALDQIRDATIDNGSFLSPELQRDAIRLRIVLEAHDGQIADAFAMFDYLKNHWKEPVDAGDTELIARLHTTLDNPNPIDVPGKISTIGKIAKWEHVLFRRSFAFAKIAGNLERFDLRCAQQTIESPITETARWTVPKRWNNCTLLVYGDPDTHFQLIEYADTDMAQSAAGISKKN